MEKFARKKKTNFPENDEDDDDNDFGDTAEDQPVVSPKSHRGKVVIVRSSHGNLRNGEVLDPGVPLTTPSDERGPAEELQHKDHPNGDSEPRIVYPRIFELDEKLEQVSRLKSGSNLVHRGIRIFESKPLPGKKRKSRRLKVRKKGALSVADSFISVIVVGPMVIGCWRGIWTLMDLNVEIFTGWGTFLVGTGLHLIFALLRNALHEKVVDVPSDCLRDFAISPRIFYQFVRISYTYVFGVACNAQWRGGWMVLKEYLDINEWLSPLVTLILLLVIVILRCTRNLLAPPFLIVIDKPNRIFQFPTRYGRNTRDWSLYILDCAFSVGIVGTLVVFVWRGVWILFDIYLFPENKKYSALGSLAIGYAIVAVTFTLQPLMRYVCGRLQGLTRLLAADAFLLLSFLATVNVWRGIWNVLDLWLLPDDQVASCWITHVGCFVFLVLLKCSNSILVRGVYIDAEEDEGKCVVFPCHYLRLFFKVEREKKEVRRRNLLAASEDFTRSTTVSSGKVAGESENGALLNRSGVGSVLLQGNGPE